MITKLPLNTWYSPSNEKVMKKAAFLREMSSKQVVLLGEEHNCPEVHRWQLHTAIQLYAYRPDMIMGFEMFAAKYQTTLDKWVDGRLTVEQFLDELNWKKTWGYPAEVYLPLFHFCRQLNIPMLALNCSRDLVKKVGVGGWESVPDSEREGITPAAPEQAGHRDVLARELSGDNEEIYQKIFSTMDDKFMRAQMTWDRAFACNIANALYVTQNKPLVVGIMGKGHMIYGYGTPYQLKSLGIKNVATFLYTSKAQCDLNKIKRYADGIYRLDLTY